MNEKPLTTCAHAPKLLTEIRSDIAVMCKHHSSPKRETLSVTFEETCFPRIVLAQKNRTVGSNRLQKKIIFEAMLLEYCF